MATKKLRTECSCQSVALRDVCENVAVRHDGILSVATAHAPPPPKPHSGDIASGAGSAAHRARVNIDTTDALFAEEVQSFLQGNTRQLASFAACLTVLTVIGREGVRFVERHGKPERLWPRSVAKPAP